MSIPPFKKGFLLNPPPTGSKGSPSSSNVTVSSKKPDGPTPVAPIPSSSLPLAERAIEIDGKTFIVRPNPSPDIQFSKDFEALHAARESAIRAPEDKDLEFYNTVMPNGVFSPEANKARIDAYISAHLVLGEGTSLEGQFDCRAKKDIPKGTIIGIPHGLLITPEELDKVDHTTQQIYQRYAVAAATFDGVRYLIEPIIKGNEVLCSFVQFINATDARDENMRPLKNDPLFGKEGNISLTVSPSSKLAYAMTTQAVKAGESIRIRHNNAYWAGMAYLSKNAKFRGILGHLNMTRASELFTNLSHFVASRSQSSKLADFANTANRLKRLAEELSKSRSTDLDDPACVAFQKLADQFDLLLAELR